MEELDITATRRVRGLGAKQREQLLAQVREVSRLPWPSSLTDRRGILFVIAGPSGVGKGTRRSRGPRRASRGFVLSVSATTRAPRPGEVDGTDYFFVDDAGFDRMVGDGEMLEWAEVFHGHRYGTPAGPCELHRDAGRDVVLEIDVEGARWVRERVPDAVMILLEPPVARRARAPAPIAAAPRLRRRRSPSAWPRPTGSSSQRDLFDHAVVNDDLERASSQVAAIIEASRARSSRPIRAHRAPAHDPTEEPSE